MTSKSSTSPKTGKLSSIPLTKLKKSPHNVRKTPHSKADIEALAASIAANGLLQNLVVEPERDGKRQATGFYLVTAGEGRRLAHLLLANRKKVAKAHPVRCIIESSGNMHEISLAENVVRTAMHPADQYEAFAKLHEEDGLSAEDIAARFGVSLHVVMQRLKLGAVSPNLRNAYRAGDMNLDQLTAFTITGDHAKQERVWAELPIFNRSRAAILRALSEGQVAIDDSCAIFIGKKAYQAAGGTIIQDLFEPHGGFFADSELLNRMVTDKLKAEANKISAEGWKWVEAAPQFDYAVTSQMRRIYPKAAPLSDEEQRQFDQLEQQHNTITEACGGDPSDDEVAALSSIEAELEELSGPPQFDKDQIATAGAFVSIDHDGGLRIERGFIRSEDAKALRSAEAGSETSVNAGGKNPISPLSEKLIAELTCHRTAALRNEMADNPDVAMSAALHALVLAIFQPHTSDGSCLRITARSPSLAKHVADIESSKAGGAMAERHAAWAQRMPQQPDAYWAFITGLSDDDRKRLLAYCVGATIDAVQETGTRAGQLRLAHAGQLANAVALDMSSYWQADVGTYLGRVSKERILEAVREGVSPQAAENLAKLKKQAMAEAAAERLEGKGWLPSLLRSPDHAPAPDAEQLLAAE